MPRKKIQRIFPRPWIADAMRDVGEMTQEQLGQRVGKTKQAINNYIIGIRDPDVYTSEAILDALPSLRKQGKTVSDFYPKRGK